MRLGHGFRHPVLDGPPDDLRRASHSATMVQAVRTIDPMIDTEPLWGRIRCTSAFAGAALNRFSVSTTPRTSHSDVCPPVVQHQQQEDHRGIGVALMHLRHEREERQHRRGEPQDEPLRAWVTDDREADGSREERGHGIADVAQRERPQERHVVADEVPAGSRLLEQPPWVPRP